MAQVLRAPDAELIGLAPVRQRIREPAVLLQVDWARRDLGLSQATPTLHMSFTGNPGTGKTKVALKMAGLLHRLGYVRKGHLVNVTRDDLVGQYIGHTAPKTREVLKKAMGGVLFIDALCHLYRPDNERDDGQEAIEILRQIMSNNRGDLVVIMAGYADRMDRFFSANPGCRSRITSTFPITMMPNWRGLPIRCWRISIICWMRAPRRRWPNTSPCAGASRISPMPA